jgi:hypothetical protein
MTVLIDHEMPSRTAPGGSGLVIRRSPHARGTDLDVVVEGRP